MSQIKEDISTNHAIAVLDGSFQSECGAVAWIMEGSSAANQIQGSMITPGAPGDHSSFRSKATGIYSILLTLHTLNDNADNTTGQIVLTCDGKSVLERLKS